MSCSGIPFCESHNMIEEFDIWGKYLCVKNEWLCSCISVHKSYIICAITWMYELRYWYRRFLWLKFLFLLECFLFLFYKMTIIILSKSTVLSCLTTVIDYKMKVFVCVFQNIARHLDTETIQTNTDISVLTWPRTRYLSWKYFRRLHQFDNCRY